MKKKFKFVNFRIYFTKLSYIMKPVSLEAGKSAERSVLGDNFNANTVWDELLFLIESVVIRLNKFGETEFS